MRIAVTFHALTSPFFPVHVGLTEPEAFNYPVVVGYRVPDSRSKDETKCQNCYGFHDCNDFTPRYSVLIYSSLSEQLCIAYRMQLG